MRFFSTRRNASQVAALSLVVTLALSGAPTAGLATGEVRAWAQYSRAELLAQKFNNYLLKNINPSD